LLAKADVCTQTIRRMYQPLREQAHSYKVVVQRKTALKNLLSQVAEASNHPLQIHTQRLRKRLYQRAAGGVLAQD
jgi:protein gp37